LGLLSRITTTSKEAIAPFDRHRNGTVLGEGAVMFVLESLDAATRRNAPVYAELAAGKTLFDSRSYLRYPARGTVLRRAIEHVLGETHLEPDSVDFVSTSANGVKIADAVESRILFSILGRPGKRPLVTASKSLFGETFSASGGFQIAYGLFGFEKNLVPPTLNCEQADTGCPVECAGRLPASVGRAPEASRIENVLVTSVSPMGYSSAVLLKSMRG
jgi:3-oxoacyl-(acyl-carrier-protein) synthase